jgi:hypothetical protein
LEGLGMENVGMCTYLMAIWYILWPFGIGKYYGSLVYLVRGHFFLFQKAIKYRYQMAIKYVHIPTFSIPRPSKIYTNWYFVWCT